MKSIKQQYIDLTEGRMSQGNFMRNLRMTMPQYVTNVTSFGDAVRILKNKGILSESYKGNDEWLKTFKSILANRYDINHIGVGDEKIISKYGNMEPEAAAKNFLEDPEADYEFIGNMDEEEVFSQGAQDESVTTTNTTDGFDNVSEEEDEKTSDEDAEFDAILKQLEDEMYGERATKSDVLDEPLEEINEGKEPKAVDENLEEVTLGITTEHECFPELDYDAIEKMVKKNIKKNPLYYTNYKLTGIRDYEVQTMDSSKPEDHQMKFYTEKTAVDTARGMKKIKVEKKKIKEALEVNPQGNLQQPQLTPSVKKLMDYIAKNSAIDTEFDRLDTETEIYQFLKVFFEDILDPNNATQDEKLRAISREVSDLRKQKSSSKVANKVFSSPQQTGLSKSFEKGELGEAEMPTEDEIEMALSSALDANPTIKRHLKRVDLKGEITGAVKALLDRTNLKNIPDEIVMAAIRKLLNDQPGPSFTAQYADNANIGKPNPALGKTLKEKLTSMVREILAEEEAPSKKTAAEEITAKAVDAIDDHNEGEGKEYKKKWLEDVFDSYESKVGHRFDDSVFEDVIDRLKAKGYTMTMKEMFDGRDNLTNISDDTKD